MNTEGVENKGMRPSEREREVERVHMCERERDLVWMHIHTTHIFPFHIVLYIYIHIYIYICMYVLMHT